MRTDDAQRELEQRALRNVRGLVDKIENEDQLGRRAQKRTFLGIVLVAVVVAVLLGVGIAMRDGKRGKLVEPPEPGQLMPDAPKAPQ